MDKAPNSETALRDAFGGIARRLETYELGRDAWMDLHARRSLLSGKLMHAWKNRERYEAFPNLGIDWKDQYISERVKLTFGARFEAVPASRIATAPVKIEHGEKAMTETCWHADVMNAKTPFSAAHVPAEISVEFSGGKKAEGIGLCLVFEDGRRPKWLPQDYQVFAITCPVTRGLDGKKIQSPSVLNPA